MIFFNDHPTPGKAYKFTNILTGDVELRTVTQRVKKSRYSDVFKQRQEYFEVTMDMADGRIITAEYEIND